MAFVIIDDPVGGQSSTVRCGQNNFAQSTYSGVLAGRCNISLGSYSLIGGGFQNKTCQSFASIFGGCNNTLNSKNGFIGGGIYNTINTGNYNLVTGGYFNKINFNNYSNINGGRQNTIDGNSGSPDTNVINGGSFNTIFNENVSTIGGGSGNIIDGNNGSFNLISGGRGNQIVDINQTNYSTIGGGLTNSIAGSLSVISGGESNTINSLRSSIVGGQGNVIDNTGDCNVILGGKGNTVSGSFSMIFSEASILTANNSVILGGSNITGTQNDTVYVPNLNIRTLGAGSSVNNLGIDIDGNIVVGSTPQDIFITGGTIDYNTGELILDNNNATQVVIDGLHDYYLTGLTWNSGTFDLTAEVNDGNAYTVNLGILSSDMTVTGGTYDPNTGVATFTTNSGNTFGVSGFTTGYTDIYLTGASYNSGTGVLTLTNTNGSTVTASGFSTGGGGGPIVVGSCTATGLLDNSSNSVANCSSVAFGRGNKILPFNNTFAFGNSILGGYCNTISGQNSYSSIVSGNNNKVSDSMSSVILAGNTNCLGFSAIYSSISAGAGNTITGSANSTIGGGQANCVVGCESAILNGLSNSVFANKSTVVGGESNVIGTYGALSLPRNSILGGGCNFIDSCSINSAIVGGVSNRICWSCGIIGGGQLNTLSYAREGSVILGGRSNTISQYNGSLDYGGFIAGGCNNKITQFNQCAFVLGSNITTNRSCTTFVNNLSIMNIPTSATGLPSGSIYRETATNYLKIVP